MNRRGLLKSLVASAISLPVLLRGRKVDAEGAIGTAQNPIRRIALPSYTWGLNPSGQPKQLHGFLDSMSEDHLPFVEKGGILVIYRKEVAKKVIPKMPQDMKEAKAAYLRHLEAKKGNYVRP